jgi:hypothetical protein
MAKVLLWLALERLVSIPAVMFISLHELLIRRVLRAMERAEGRHGLVDMVFGED